MIAAKKEWCNICKCEHIEGNHRKEIYDIQSVYDSILRYEKLGFTSDYIHVAIKERIKSILSFLK